MSNAKVNWDMLNPEIKHEGRAITLPGDPAKMPTQKAIDALVRLQQDESQPFKVFEEFDAYPFDAAVAFCKAMTKLYGWASPQSTPGFFGPRPPVMLTIRTGHRDEDVVQCPMGAFKLPGVDNNINTTIVPREKRPVFIVHGEIQKKDRHIVLELVTEAKRILKEESIYRGKAIRLGVDDYGNLDTENPPVFFDTTGTDPVLLDDDIMEQVETSILTPIRETALCKKHKIPLKRGNLLEGPYGTGKTLIARMTAGVAEANGWTFILIDKVQGMRAALEFANRYAPAVVFAEDVDRVAEERDDAANDLVNTIDGIISKRAEIMVVLTTNFVEKLNPVILRPGRLDAVISLRAPNGKTVEKLIRHYAGKLLAEDIDLTGAGVELSGQIPASIRECVERAKLGMVRRQDNKLSGADLVTAAKTMKNHLALLNRDQKVETPAEMLANSLRSVVHNGGKTVDDVHPMIRDTLDLAQDIRDNLN